MIPAFLAQPTGTSLGTPKLWRRDLLVASLPFVAGFSVIFASLGVVLKDYLTSLLTQDGASRYQ